MTISSFIKSIMPDTFSLLMVVAVGLAFAFPHIGRPDGLFHLDVVTKFGVVLIFFIYGASLNHRDLKDGLRSWPVHIITQFSTFILFPIIGLFLYVIARTILTPPLDFGFFFLATLSTTISSCVALTSIARGNVPASVFNATLSSLIGLVMTPALIALIMSTNQASFPVVDSIIQVSLILLLPFAAGQLLRPWLKSYVERYSRLARITERAVILLIIFSSFSASVNDGVWQKFSLRELVITGLLIALALGTIIILTIALSRMANLSRHDEVAVVFCGGTKSLVNGVAISQVLFADIQGVGLLLLPLLLFHQLQLFIFGFMAKHYAERY